MSNYQELTITTDEPIYLVDVQGYQDNECLFNITIPALKTKRSFFTPTFDKVQIRCFYHATWYEGKQESWERHNGACLLSFERQHKDPDMISDMCWFKNGEWMS